MWPFKRGPEKPSPEQIRQDIIDGFADSLEHAWSVGTLRSSRSLKHPKSLLKMVLAIRLRALGRGAGYDVVWAAAMLLPDFQDMTEQEEAELRMHSAQMDGLLTADTISVHAKGIESAFALISRLTGTATGEREKWVLELKADGLTPAGSRY